MTASVESNYIDTAPQRERHTPDGVVHALEIRGLSKTFTGGHAPAVDDFSIDVRQGEIVCFLGPSGCGKTTILRMIAGLEEPSAGSITYDGTPLFDASAGVLVPAHQRGFGMVFQSYALWPHMSVHQNVEYPLLAAKTPRRERKPRVEQALTRVGLAGLGERRINELSGGQQQRVAVARAVVGEPRMVFFDEPLSNLDANLRTTMRRDIRLVMKQAGLSGIYVTHDQSEAFAVADRVAILRHGRLQQCATPEELVRSRDAFVAKFLRIGPVLRARLMAVEESGKALRINIAGAERRWSLTQPPTRVLNPGQDVNICIPTASLRLTDDGIPGTVEWCNPTSDGGWEVGVEVPNQEDPVAISTERVVARPIKGETCHFDVHGPVTLID